MSKSSIVKILMERDGLTEQEAKEQVNQVQLKLNEAIANETNVYRLSNDLDSIIEDETRPLSLILLRIFCSSCCLLLKGERDWLPRIS